jgi:hypothetical protein
MQHSNVWKLATIAELVHARRVTVSQAAEHLGLWAAAAPLAGLVATG